MNAEAGTTGGANRRVLTILVDMPTPAVTGVHLRQLANLSVLQHLGSESSVLVFTTPDRPFDASSLGPVTNSAADAGSRVEYMALPRVQRLTLRARLTAAAVFHRPSKHYPFSIPYDLAGLEAKTCAEAARLGVGYVVLPTSLLHIAPALRAQGVEIIGDALDVLSQLTLGFLKSQWRHRPLHAPGLFANYVACRTQESLFLRECSEIWAASDSDAEYLRKKAPAANVFVCGNAIDNATVADVGSPDTAAIGFIGTYTYTPNLDAAQFLANEVLPLVRRSQPFATLRLAGKGLSKAQRDALSAVPGVEVLGAVPDAAQFVQSCTVMALPIRLRGGVPLKLIESLACRRAVVATPELVEGLDVEAGRDLLVAGTAVGFAQHVIDLFTDPERSQRIAESGHDRFVEQYSYPAMHSRAQDQSVLSTKRLVTKAAPKELTAPTGTISVMPGPRALLSRPSAEQHHGRMPRRYVAINNYSIANSLEGVRRETLPRQHLYGVDHLVDIGCAVQAIDLGVSASARLAKRLAPDKLGAWVDPRQLSLALAAAAKSDATLYAMNAYALGNVFAGRAVHRRVVAVVHDAFQGRYARQLARTLGGAVCLTERAASVLADNGLEHVAIASWGPDLLFPGYVVAPESAEFCVVSLGSTARDFTLLFTAIDSLNVAGIVNAPSDLTLPRSVRHLADVAAAEGYNRFEETSYERPMVAWRQASVFAIPLTGPFDGPVGLTEVNDALALGRPIVMTRTPGLGFDIEAEGLGIWVDPHDPDGWTRAIRFFRDDTDARVEMGRKAREFASQRWNNQRYSHDLDAFLRRIRL